MLCFRYFYIHELASLLQHQHIHARTLNKHITRGATAAAPDHHHQHMDSVASTLDAGTGLPFQSKAHDALRNGLASLKEDAKQKHPVHTIQEETAIPGMGNHTNPQMLRDMYGLAFPAKVDIEKQILSKFGRLPGLPSSRLGLESLTGELDQFGFESYLGLPEFSEQLPVDMHSQMEQRLGMGSSTKPLARGMF